MLIYLYGADSYSRNKKLKEIVDAYTKKHGIGDVLSVDLEESPDNWKEVKKFLTQASLFVQSKLVVIKNCREVEEKDWLKLLKSHFETKDAFLIISDNKKPKKAFSFLLEKPVESQEYPRLEGIELESFIKKETQKRKLSLTPDAYKFFLAFLNAQTEPSWVAINELEKIELAKFPSPLTLESLKKLITWREKNEVFELAKYLSATKDYRRALPILERLYLQKDAPAHLFNSLPYCVYGKDLDRLLEYDISVKSGGLEYEEALLDFVLGR